MTDFDVWYQAYPRHDGKKDALKAWRSLKPDAETVRAMMDALVWQIPHNRWTKERRQWTPLPASYLRGERWTDEAPQTAAHTVQMASEDDKALARAIRENHSQMAADRARDYEISHPWLKVH